MRKIGLLIILTLILTGCSSQYNIKIESDKITENIDIVIDKSLIPDYSDIKSDANISPDDQITPFINGKQYPIFGQRSKVYNKKVTDDATNYYIKLNYVFRPEEYGNSYALKGCFENIEYESVADYYYIKLSGNFYCLYGNELEINVETPNVVKEENADSKSMSTYKWKIDKSNVNDVDITIKVLKKTKINYYMTWILLGVVGIILVIGGLVVFHKFSNRKNVNEI